MVKRGKPYLRRGPVAPRGPGKHNLRAWREWFEWTIEMLSEKSGCSVAAISAYERGADDPSLDALEKLARAFGVPRGMLLDVNPADDPPLWTSVLRASKGQPAAPSPPGGRPRGKT